MGCWAVETGRGWPCRDRTKKTDEPINGALSKSLSISCFIPPEFVGVRFAPEQSLVYSIFPPVQPGTGPEEEGVLAQGVAGSCGRCVPLSPGTAPVARSEP